ncbi:hypothetical protein FZ983_30395 [Azospirillum sp. B21]|uniref:phage head spike fiber domain-containing protein n=1 Tax=Azospirillum sp. B21 TaxID=2607496 RepID=UPI0011EC5C96|nr:hypothetical protein [Azospirillum sp. B21]KAA0573326.1 hypothetical protein FZ983_30395 [Azospirillum sp. B21]
MATFNGRDWTVADMLPFKYVENWDAFFDDVIAEMDARSEGVGEASEAAIAAAALVAPAVPIVTAARDQAVAAANTAAGIVQHVQPSEIAGIDPIIDFPFSGPAAVPSGVITGSSGKWVMGQNGLLTYVASGTAPIEYAPVTSALRGLRIEESRVNRVMYSAAFDNAAWTKFGATVSPNVAFAPDGTFTADKLIDDTSTGVHAAYQAATVPAGVICGSVHASAAERSKGEVMLYNDTDGIFVSAYFDLATGTIAMNSGTGSCGIEVVGNYYRPWVSGTTAAANSRLYVRLRNNSGGTSYAGDGSSGMYVWGTQVEAGSFPTSYIPTTSSTVTRAADVNTLLLSNVSGWNPNEGAIYASGTAPPMLPSGAAQVLWQIDGGSPANRLLVQRGSDGGLSAYSIVGGSVVAVTFLGILANNSPFKVSFGWKAGSFAASLNGGGAVTASGGAIPTGLTTLRIGHDTAGYHLNGWLSRLTGFSRRLADPIHPLLTA